MPREEALNAERQIKGWSRRKKEALINGDWQALSYQTIQNVKVKSGLYFIRTCFETVLCTSSA